MTVSTPVGTVYQDFFVFSHISPLLLSGKSFAHLRMLSSLMLETEPQSKMTSAR